MPTTTTKKKKPATERGTYVYGVIDASTELEDPPAGVPHGDRPYLLPLYKNVAAVAAQVPLSEYGAEKLEERLKDLEWVSKAAVGHDGVVEHYARRTATVPMRLFTLFSSDERAKKDLSARRSTIDRTLDRVRGREEWGVRLRYDEPRALAIAAKQSSTKPKKAESGTRFLERKKGERDVREHFRANAAKDAAAVFDELAVASDGAVRRAAPAAASGARVILDAAFLVREKDRERFHEQVKTQAARLEPLGYDLALTGPWPPYNFVGGNEP